MPRTARAADGGIVYHVLNRGNGRMKIFRKPGDYEAFVGLILDAKQRACNTPSTRVAGRENRRTNNKRWMSPFQLS